MSGEETALSAVSYSRVDLNRLSARELWHMSPPLAFPFLWVRAKLGTLPFAPPVAHLPFARLRTDAERIPFPVRTALLGKADALKTEGFGEPAWVTTPDDAKLPGMSDATMTVQLHRELPLLALATDSASVRNGRRFHDARVGIVTFLSNGRRLVTTNGRPKLDAPPWDDVVRLVDADASRLVAVARRRLDAIAPGESVVAIRDWDAYAALSDRDLVRLREHWTATGKYVPLSAADVDVLRNRR